MTTPDDHPQPGCSPDTCSICLDMYLHETPTQAADRNNRKTERLLQLRTASARNLSFRVTEPHPHVRAAWAAHFAALLSNTAPDGYAAALAKLRAANATPESTFADRYAAERTRALDDEHARHAARLAERPTPRLTAAELSTYAPPNGYAAGLAALKKEKR